jgi:hypothetical protein
MLYVSKLNVIGFLSNTDENDLLCDESDSGLASDKLTEN